MVLWAVREWLGSDNYKMGPIRGGSLYHLLINHSFVFSAPQTNTSEGNCCLPLPLAYGCPIN